GAIFREGEAPAEPGAPKARQEPRPPARGRPMSAAVDRARELEGGAGRAWGGAEEGALGGWRPRGSGRGTQRGNPVWPRSGEGTMPVEAKLTAVEAFYAARGLPARYQMTIAAVPAGLDAELAARGYALICPCLVMTATVGDVRARAGEDAGVA